MKKDTKFKKGNAPWNKNLKGIHLSPKSEFKKGSRPINWCPIGTIKERKDKNGGIRKWIKFEEPNKWIELAKHVWLCNGGLIPKGFIIHHVDFNKANDDISNLSCMTRGAHLKVHDPIKYRTYKKKNG
jgi:hypothetical protein